jgi:hypothetical protein
MGCFSKIIHAFCNFRFKIQEKKIHYAQNWKSLLIELKKLLTHAHH